MKILILCVVVFMITGCWVPAELEERHKLFIESGILKPWPWSSELRPSNVQVAVRDYGAGE